jgi:hypothetical protein
MALIDKAREKLSFAGRQLRRFVRTSSSRGFILILVVGATAVLAVLGYSFIEQSRTDLRGAEASRDANAADAVGEVGFQIALRALADDTNVPSASTGIPKSVAAVGGSGWTGRWGYNPNYINAISAVGAYQSMPGIMNDMSGHGGEPNMAFSRDLTNPVGPGAFLDSWQTLIWNEQPLNALNPLSSGNTAYAYNYKWDPQAMNTATNPYTASSLFLQRKPTDPKMLLDTWPLQPLARVREFLAHSGNTYGIVQVSIVPTDGAINVNGMYDPGTCYERPGYYDTQLPGTLAADPLARDRRTLEYVLGRRPEWAYRHAELRSYGPFNVYPIARLAAPYAPTTGVPYAPNWQYWIPDCAYDQCQCVANQPAGSCYLDNGVYNFSRMFEPNGRQATNVGKAGGVGPADMALGQYVAQKDAIPPTAPIPVGSISPGPPPVPPVTIPGDPGAPAITQIGVPPPQGLRFPAYACFGRNEFTNQAEPMLVYGAGALAPNRYNFEGSRYPLWVATAGPSMLGDFGALMTPGMIGTYGLEAPTVVLSYQWYPTGRFLATAVWYSAMAQPVGSGSANGLPDLLFHGFGFDRLVPKRGGYGGGFNDMYVLTDLDATPGGTGKATTYNGAGMYGNPQSHSFQLHYINAVAMGRFWTDLMANWYFGGSPGYTNRLGRSADDAWVSQWAHLGSSYDSCGIGTNWMPPTTHVSIPGATTVWHDGSVTSWESKCGMVQHPRNMPPAKPAATYCNPISPGADDFGMPSPQWKFAAQRHMVRAFGMQENWGPGTSNATAANQNANLYYDAPNINVAPYEVIYGLLTPEKFPSMMNRTVVAPHLHWKARLLDAAYQNMDKYHRYTLLDYTKWVGGATTADPLATNNYGIHAACPYYPKGEFSSIPGPPVIGYDHTAPAPLDATIVPPTQVEDPFGFVDTKGLAGSWKPYDVTDMTGSSMGPSPWNYSIHKSYQPIPRDSNYAMYMPSNASDCDPASNAGGLKMSVLGKMDYTTPEPLIYKGIDQDMKGSPMTVRDIRHGSGEPQDDVFVNCHYDLELSPNVPNANDTFDGKTAPYNKYSLTVSPRFYSTDNADWFQQRLSVINYVYNDPSSYLPWLNIPYLPSPPAPPNTVDPSYGGDALGTVPTYPQAMGTGGNARLNPNPKPHPFYGLPNPDYMLLFPQSGEFSHPNYDWAHQFRRYFPVWGAPAKINPVTGVPTPPMDVSDVWTSGGKGNDLTGKKLVPPDYGSFPSAPPTYEKMVDCQNICGYTSNAYPFAPNPPVGGPPPAATDPKLNPTLFVNPLLPTPKGTTSPTLTSLFVPGISKDDAWRITRVGRKYQEIIADAIMDYQVNPFWPNPCVQFTETNVPLDALTAKNNDVRNQAFGLDGMNDNKNAAPNAGKNNQGTNNRAWLSFDQRMTAGEPALGYQIPDYYAYWNRFWCRAAHMYTRDFNDTVFGTDLRAGAPYKSSNPTEARGIYPQTKQYLGQFYSNPNPQTTVPGWADTGSLSWFFKDQIVDFPDNTLEDQTGSEWRYVTAAFRPMMELALKLPAAAGAVVPMGAQYSAAPARNHPFKNWADFVAMVGHLVYRSPMEVACPGKGIDTWWTSATPSIRDARVAIGIRDSVLGVNANAVCHGKNADPRNQGSFFDGSSIPPSGSANMPDALQGYYTYTGKGGVAPAAGGRAAGEAIVAVDGFWPISGNFGAYPDPSGSAKSVDDLMYPPGLMSVWTKLGSTVGECQRRLDELRGRDAAGLRIEHHYISEAAANDILVSLSNGQIGPIDFNGDGHVEMTRKKDIPLRGDVKQWSSGNSIVSGKPADYWPKYPYNSVGGKSAIVEYRDTSAASGATGSLDYGVVKYTNCPWTFVNNNEVIQNCVTQPIKFRSNTFAIHVTVELADDKYRGLGSVHKFSRTYSRIPGTPTGKNVHGPYTGEFILHGSRACDAVDPEMQWLGTDPAYNE